MSRPAVLEVEQLSPSPRPCHCFCGARHPDRMGVCLGDLRHSGVLVHLNSIYASSDGVALCQPCADAWPETLA